MKNKSISKVALSLLIALAFIMPINAMADGGVEAGEEQFINDISDWRNNPNQIPIESALQDAIVCIEDINLSPKMQVDCYDINVTVSNTPLTLLGEELECEIKLFMDIFKEEDIPKEEIICFDFEDTGDIYNYWDSIDDTTDDTSGPGGIDTWTRSDQRSVSPSYSMHNSQFDDHYMGNQLDYLMATIPIPDDYDELIVEFCSWVEGEHVYDGDGTEILHDYGWVEYSWDGVTWTTFGDYYYNETEWNCSKEYTITGASGHDTLYWRFGWTSGPICQNEGWYIDDVCFYGREAPDLGQLVFTTHSLQEFAVPANSTIYYEFPETWCPDEGNYTIRIWMLSETPECEVCYPQADPFFFNITIGDVMDIAVTHNQILHPIGDTFECEEYLLVNGTVCNEGTLDAYDVPVTFSISRQVKTTLYNDLVEGVYYPDTYIPYKFENPDTTTVEGCNFGSNLENDDYSQSGFWHIDDFNSVSPTHSWFNADDTDHYPAGIADGLTFNFEEIGFDIEDMADVADFDITADINIQIDSGDRVYMQIVYGNTWVSFGYSSSYYFYPTFGTNTGGFVPMSFRDLAVAVSGPYGFEIDQNPIYDMITNFADAYGDPVGIGFYLDSVDRDDTDGLATGDWSGVMIDNIKMEKVEIGDEVYSEVIIIDELLIGECVEVEFMWDDIPTGDFIECKSVPDDDNNDNNELCDSFSVKILWDEIDEIDVESYDLTEGYDCHWHVVTSGYNQYLWAGEDDPCTYMDDYNDILLFAPDGEPCLDWTGGSPIYLEFDEWAEIEYPYDEVKMEIYPYCEDIGYQWYEYNPATTPILLEDFEVPPAAPIIPFSAPGWTQYDNIGGQGWLQVQYGTFPYEPTQLSFPGVQYASSFIGMWFVPASGSQVDEGIMFGPIDMTVWPATFITVDERFVISNWVNASEINAYSGVVPAFEETLVDQAALAPGFIYTRSPTFVWDSQHSNYADMNNVWIEFASDMGPWYGIECFHIDDMLIEGGYLPAPATYDYGWRHTKYEFTPDMFTNPITGDTFLNEIGAFTDEMEFRIRMISDGGVHYRGFMIDNIEMYNGGTILELDEADTMDNFICDTIIGGDYWYYNATWGGWQCMDQIANVIPNDVDCALVWETSVPHAVAAELQFTHEFDLDTNDYCYLEFSTDGGSSWVAPIRWTGTGSGDVTIDMSSFTGDNVLIRWRVDTNSTMFSHFYRVKDVKIYADIDTEAPHTIGTLSGTVIHGWYSTPVTFTATATDDYSGVFHIYYKIDGGSTLTYSAPITISVNGEHYVEYWAVDNVGNEEVHHITPTFKIDTGAAPIVSITAPGDGLYLFGNQLLSLSGRTIIIGGFTVEASASDSDSGIFRVQFALDGTIFGEDTTSPFSAYCGEKHTGAGTITVTAQDFTGNTASASKDITYFKFL